MKPQATAAPPAVIRRARAPETAASDCAVRICPAVDGAVRIPLPRPPLPRQVLFPLPPDGLVRDVNLLYIMLNLMLSDGLGDITIHRIFIPMAIPIDLNTHRRLLHAVARHMRRLTGGARTPLRLDVGEWGTNRDVPHIG